MQSASYASAVYQPSRDVDPYGASRFDGKKVRGELDQKVLDHTLRNIPNRPKGRQPCALFVGYSGPKRSYDHLQKD
ncbi:jg11554 [Pararge aegeria aegeria]|uniref:Jg11554 protein n=1 Tax=Pararge aegeria aegeria TaxID=348720 RepID=A0A8S4QPF1_9NEOP|nr:jg11554 [Pararge aegeria aegeria]